MESMTLVHLFCVALATAICELVHPQLTVASVSYRVAAEQPAKPRALSVKTLSQLVKSALSLEVECGELQARLMDALRAERWRGRVEAALRSNSKYTSELAGVLCIGSATAPVVAVCIGVSTSWESSASSPGLSMLGRALAVIDSDYECARV